MSVARSEQAPQVVGRYMLCRPLAVGGMGTIYLGRMVGHGGFSRVVAIKRLHAGFAGDPTFAAMTMDEARLASRVRHPNVVQTLDVVAVGEEVLLVLEYVHGETLAKLVQASIKERTKIAPSIVVAVMAGALHGLHAAHEATSEHGHPLHLVHRDVSPQNIIVGIDGVPRVCDFGVAKATGRLLTTTQGELKGKLGYMAPEQIAGEEVDRRVDVFAAAVVAWEALTCRRLFHADNEAAVLKRVLEAPIAKPSELAPNVPPALDDVVLRALSRDPAGRFPSAHDFAVALERAVAPETPRVVGEWVAKAAANALEIRADDVAEIEALSLVDVTPQPPPPPAPPAPAAAEARSRWPIGRVLAFAAAAAVIFLSGFGLRRLDAPRPAPASASGSPVATTSAAPPAEEAPAPPVSVATAGPEPSASAAPSPRPPPKRPVFASPTRRAAASRPGGEPATPACEPPYTYFDPVEHIDKVKPECRNVAR